MSFSAAVLKYAILGSILMIARVDLGRQRKPLAQGKISRPWSLGLRACLGLKVATSSKVSSARSSAQLEQLSLLSAA
jgi:hypothetical protein